MFQKASPAEQLVSQSAEEWRNLGLETLSHRGLQERLGIEKSRRLHNLAHRAGKILIHDEIVTMTRSHNGLYIMPIPEDLRHDLVATIPVHGINLHLPVGQIAKVPNPLHIGVDEQPTFDIISVPVATPYLHNDTEKKAVFVHELIHADQERRPVQAPADETTFQHDTRLEAEAYAGQFAVLDHEWNGQLTPLVAANLGHDDIRVLYYPKELLPVFNASLVMTNALGAVVRSAVHNYTADGITTPSHLMSQEYLRLDHIYA